ncbi:MAG: GNAT family N-acetyltransferase [Acidimicrobiia bacterium]|nr:GNAT family N-acetyltransferase [Acidimicrobiia bacterium]
MIELRPATEEEMGAVGTLGGYVYGGTFGDGPESMTATANRAEWTLCAFDGDRLVSTFITIPFTMRMNGAAVAMGGVSGVGTLPDYRRRGLMRQLMTRATEEMRDRGQTVASLWASQAAIYQRFGYAIGSSQRTYRVDPADIAFHDGDTGLGDVELLDADAGFEAVKALYIAFVADRTGYLHRSRALWHSGPFERNEAEGPVSVALSRDGSGEPNGYLVYTLRGDRTDHRARSQELTIRDFAWLGLDAYRSLWEWVARHDLVGRVLWSSAPADDPADELFSEPRLLHTQDTEGIWFRVIDVEPALAARGYTRPGQATLTVLPDDLTPWNAGTYSVETDGTSTEVERLPSGAEADITLPIKALGSLFTGHRSARRLGSWGLIEGSDDAYERVDALLATRHLPHAPDHF